MTQKTSTACISQKQSTNALAVYSQTNLWLICFNLSPTILTWILSYLKQTYTLPHQLSSVLHYSPSSLSVHVTIEQLSECEGSFTLQQNEERCLQSPTYLLQSNLFYVSGDTTFSPPWSLHISLSITLYMEVVSNASAISNMPSLHVSKRK